MVLFYAELPILARINAKMHYFETEIIGEGDTPSPLPLPSALAAPSPIFANPPVIFFTILTLPV